MTYTTSTTPFKTQRHYESRINLGEAVLDVARRGLFIGSTEVPLTSGDFDLLLILANEPHDIVSRNTLFKRLYGSDWNGLSRNVDIRVCRLKKRLFSTTNPFLKILTVRGKGYKIQVVNSSVCSPHTLNYPEKGRAFCA